jgi:hypothetical protein
MFLNNYLRIFYTSFPLKKVIERVNKNHWITPGLRISCNQKKYLYLLSRDSNDANMKKHYKQYCKILARVIIEAKRSMYNNQMVNSVNKMKTTRNIIKAETNRMDIRLANIKILLKPSTNISYMQLRKLFRIYKIITKMVLIIMKT